MRLNVQTNPIFYETDIIEGYINNSRVTQTGVRPTVTGQIHRISRGLFSSSIHLIYPKELDRVGDVAEENPHSTWIAFAGVFTSRRQAYDWTSAVTREWSTELSAWMNLPNYYHARSPEEQRNAVVTRRARRTPRTIVGEEDVTRGLRSTEVRFTPPPVLISPENTAGSWQMIGGGGGLGGTGIVGNRDQAFVTTRSYVSPSPSMSLEEAYHQVRRQAVDFQAIRSIPTNNSWAASAAPQSIERPQFDPVFLDAGQAVAGTPHQVEMSANIDEEFPF